MTNSSFDFETYFIEYNFIEFDLSWPGLQIFCTLATDLFGVAKTVL